MANGLVGIVGDFDPKNRTHAFYALAVEAHRSASGSEKAVPGRGPVTVRPAPR